MGTVERKATGTETLRLSECPDCSGDVTVKDSVYSIGSVGSVVCGGCGLKWVFREVKDAWHVGEMWNDLADRIRKRLLVFSLLTVATPSKTSRDFKREELEEEARKMLEHTRRDCIGGTYG